MVTKKMFAAAVLLYPALAQAQPGQKITEPSFNDVFQSELEYVVRSANGTAIENGNRGLVDGELDLHMTEDYSLHPSFLFSGEHTDYVANAGSAQSLAFRTAMEFRAISGWEDSAGFLGAGLAYRRDQKNVFLPENLTGYSINNSGGIRVSLGLSEENILFTVNGGLYFGKRSSSFDSDRTTFSAEGNICITPRISIFLLPVCTDVLYSQLISIPLDRRELNLNFSAMPGFQLNELTQFYIKAGANYMPHGFVDDYQELSLGGGLKFAAD